MGNKADKLFQEVVVFIIRKEPEIVGNKAGQPSFVRYRKDELEKSPR